MFKKSCLVACAMAVTVGSAFLARSAFGIDVMTAEPGSMSWTTVRTKTVSLAVDWPESATEAWLITTDIRDVVVRQERIPFGAESVEWTAFEGDAPTEDTLYSLRLQFYTGTTEGGNLKALSNNRMSLAVLRGAFGDGIAVLSDTASADWRLVKPTGFLVGYDSAWVGGTAPCVLAPVRAETSLFVTTNACASGWSAFPFDKTKWNGRGAFELTAAFGGTDETLVADLEFLVPGSLFFVR